MGRPRSHTVEYFSHDTNASDGRTITIIEGQFGIIGYAFWYKLLELLGRTSGHYYDARLVEDLEFLCRKCGVDRVSGTGIINKLADLNAIDKILWEHQVIWSQNFVTRLNDVYRKRGVPLPPKPNFCDGNCKHIVSTQNIPVTGIIYNEPSNIIPTPESTQSKVKETIESKVKETIEYVFSCYEKNIGQLTPFIADSIQDALRNFPEEWIPEAIKIAVERNTRKWSYVEGILKNWQVNGKNNGHKPLQNKSITSIKDYRVVEHKAKDGVIIDDNGNVTPA